MAWRVLPGSHGVIADIHPTTGVAQFSPRQRVATIQISILPDPTPEVQKDYYVVLGTPTGGLVLGADTQANFSVR